MAADSAGVALTAVVTCEGDLDDPEFAGEFERTLDSLQGILEEGPIKVHKLEPWNSVRVTLSIPREAALRLRQLANDGSQQLRALGILSVQVEGDQVISLRLAATSSTAESQEIVLRTAQDGSGSSGSTSLSQLLVGASSGGESVVSSATATASNSSIATSSEKVQFRSPNVVCPSDSIVPKVPVGSASNAVTPPTTKTFAGPFPFTSMNQAMHSNGNGGVGVSTPVANFSTPPPPYPGKHPPVTLSSPLLVNLLQNEGTSTTNSTASSTRLQSELISTNKVRTLPSTQQASNNKILYNVLPQRQHITNATLSMQQQQKLVIREQPSQQQQQQHQKSQHMQQQQQHHQQQQQAPSTQFVGHHNHNLSQVASTTSSVSTPIATVRNPTVPYNLFNPQPQTQLPPPSYPNTIRQWGDSLGQHYQQQMQQSQMPQLQELMPSLTDLKADLDQLLPSLERDLAGSPPDLPDDLLNDKSSKTVYLINPLTGELEPQSSSDSEEEEYRDVFTGLPSPSTLSDEDTNSTIRPDTTDQSDSESRSCHSDSSKHSKIKGRNRDAKGRDSPSVTGKPTEKIKLRLKLEKSEPVSPAYKVDVSYINTQQSKKSTISASSTGGSVGGGIGEEPRVPPLHISLRGRNHAVINNKKKVKMSATDKIRKVQQVKKDQGDEDCDYESRKVKKPKLTVNEIKKIVCLGDAKDVNTYVNLHFKEKLKERRGSDSELARNNKKFTDSNGVLSDEKKRRLSQTEDNFESLTSTTSTSATVLGSTNMGTMSSIASHKIRKEKAKLKENFKNKELNRFKSYSKNLADISPRRNKQQQQQQLVALPTGEIDMEAKFKQRLMEDGDRIVTTTVQQINIPNNTLEVTDPKVEDLIQTLTNPPPIKDKPPEPDKCNTPDRKNDDKPPNHRSPNSGAQGEDSGIESMDALSEKSPNQASQSPHEEIPDPTTLPSKTKTHQVPDILDIEAQLAKMEGLHSEDDLHENSTTTTNNTTTKSNLEHCCVLTSALQDSLCKGTVSLTPQPQKTTSSSSSNNATTAVVAKEQQSLTMVMQKQHQPDVSILPTTNKSKTLENHDLEPLPIRVTPPLYTYSNPEKRGTDSPTLMSDTDINISQCSPILPKSLLEQLLIEIPTENQIPASSPSPATRSVRTRASSKLNSPEQLLNSPKPAKSMPTAKRKRLESDSSGNNGIDVDQRNKKPRKCSENTIELIKACLDPTTTNKVVNNSSGAATSTMTVTTNMPVTTSAAAPNLVNPKKVLEESSDSDEPLIEVVGKVRSKSNNNSTNGANAKVKLKGSVNAPPFSPSVMSGTRRSIRAVPAAVNTRSKGDKSSNPDNDIIRRKTRSTVSEGEGKRKKDIK